MTTSLVLVAGTIANGLLTGASLDQSIKQLPARHRMGVLAFSRYSRAADLANGVFWYAILGVGTALLTLVAAGVTLAGHPGPLARLAMVLAIVATVWHSAATGVAAPTNFRQRRVADDEVALETVLRRFARWQWIRLAGQVVALLALAVGVAVGVSR